jgi:hypothetical protein
LNQIEDDDTEDDELNTAEMLEKYADKKNLSTDPDYVAEEEPSSEDISTESDSDEERTESQKRLNDKTTNGFSSDKDESLRGKSKKETHFTTLDPTQFTDLENELVEKILKHLKDNNNFPQSSNDDNEIFFSPIGEIFLISITHNHVHQLTINSI